MRLIPHWILALHHHWRISLLRELLDVFDHSRTVSFYGDHDWMLSVSVTCFDSLFQMRYLYSVSHTSHVWPVQCGDSVVAQQLINPPSKTHEHHLASQLSFLTASPLLYSSVQEATASVAAIHSSIPSSISHDIRARVFYLYGSYPLNFEGMTPVMLRRRFHPHIHFRTHNVSANCHRVAWGERRLGGRSATTLAATPKADDVGDI